MIVWAWMFLTIILILLGFIWYKYKFVAIIQCFWIWILMAFNNGGGDYNGYVQMYNQAALSSPSFGRSDYLYGKLSFWGNCLSLDLLTFNIITVSIGLLLLYKFVFYSTSRPSVALSLFMLYPMADFVMQRRTFLSTVVILIALQLLQKSKHKNKIFIYILLCLLAGGLHNVGYIYLVVPIINYVRLQKLKKYLWIMVGLSVLLLPLYPIIAGKLFQASKVELYFSALNNRMSLWKVFIYILLQIVFLIFHKKIYEALNYKRNEMIIKIDYLMLAIAPLYYYNSTFFRIYRDILPLQYINFSMLFDKKNVKVWKYSLCFLYILWIVAFFIFQYAATGNLGFDLLIKNTIFENNYILQFTY